ncbi:MAG: hypothetical protein EDM74_10700 [Armatimonadetes bacterium]|nr:MAG: hypothetical protein EDM74_10700 [Armatimonadota bacterium]
MNLLVTLLATSLLSQLPQDAKVLDLGDGYSRVVTATYSVELPTGWDISSETRWGQRKAHPNGSNGELGIMTAPPGQQSSDELYHTSLFFILREKKGKPTPYRLGKTSDGLETASFEVVDRQGFAARRYILIRNVDGRLLALSVHVPNREADKQWSAHFERLLRTARFIKQPL